MIIGVMAGSLHRFFTNIICGCIYNKDVRKRTRVILNSPMADYIRFIRKNTGLRLRKIKTFTGYQARSLLISVNDQYIFKFPLRRANSDELTRREARLVSALSPLSPIYVPPVAVFTHRGVLVRRYEFIHGVQLRQMPLDVVLANIDVLADQIARFIFEIGRSNPKEICDLKPSPDALPGYMYGWSQGDICDNFMVDMETMKIVAFIDWEDCAFGDFSSVFTRDKRSPHRELMDATRRAYDRMYSAMRQTEMPNRKKKPYQIKLQQTIKECSMKLKQFCVNLICVFVPNAKLRRKIRVVLNNPSVYSYLKFVRKWAKNNCGGVRKITINFGVGCQNLVVVLNNAHVFKFPLSGGAIAQRELRICDALCKITPIHIPQMEIIKWRGIDIRRYEFICGKLLCDFPVSTILANREKIVQQLAYFMYVIGCANPQSIRDLKPVPEEAPGYLRGWFHNDIGQNFLMDNNLNIVGFIDWEGAAFCDWRQSLRMAERFWNKNGYKGLMTDVLTEYTKLYYCDRTKKNTSSVA